MPAYKSVFKMVLIGVIGLVVALLAMDAARSIRGPVDRARAAALDRDTLEAAADTTRRIYIKGAALGDSLELFQRRVVQAEQKADALDRALGLERVARQRLEVRIAGLTRVVRGETVTNDVADMRRATFRVREAPYTVDATVDVPPPPGQGTMNVKVDLDTLELELRLGCGPPNRFGVRAATTNVVSPAWANLRIGRVEQAVSVCAATPEQAHAALATGLRRFAQRIGVSAGFAAARQPSGEVIAGPGLMIGFRVWP